MSGDLQRSDEWYPRECALCTREAALACDDPTCRARRLGEDYDEPTSPDPGDGRQWCTGCQRWKFLVIHSCPGVPQSGWTPGEGT